MDVFRDSLARAQATLRRIEELDAEYRAGRIHVHVPEALLDGARPLDELTQQLFSASHAAFEAADRLRP